MILYENVGDSPAYGVMIEDVLSTGITFLPGTAGGGGAHVKAGRTLSGLTYIIWRLGRPIVPGERGQVYFKARIN